MILANTNLTFFIRCNESAIDPMSQNRQILVHKPLIQ